MRAHGLAIDIETKMFHWRRGLVAPLSEHFSTTEFDCHCGQCPDQTINPLLIEKLEALRADLNESIHVISGFRCAAYQQQLAAEGYQTAAGRSSHELGNAADISVRSMGGHSLEVYAQKYFMAMGAAIGWLHVDLRIGRTRRWVYS